MARRRRCSTSHGAYDLYNVGTGVGASVAEIAGMIQHTVGRPVARQELPDRFALLLPNWCVLNPGKIQRERGWKITITLQEGIRRLLVQGALRRPLDIFDLAMHATPLLLVAIKLWRQWRAPRP